MRAKLVKTENGYGLDDCDIIAFYSKNRPVHKHYKLSKENCDEIFGIVDVDAIYNEAKNEFCDDMDSYIEVFTKYCISKAMELDKDKLFTLEDMFNLYAHIVKNGIISGEEANEFIQSLQQPTEIEVDIINLMDCQAQVSCDETKTTCRICTNTGIPKLDEDGCLILKKKV